MSKMNDNPKQKVKAWRASTEYSEYSLVVFAETRGKARAIAAGCEECELLGVPDSELPVRGNRS